MHRTSLSFLSFLSIASAALGCSREGGGGPDSMRDAAALDEQAHATVSLETALVLVEELSAGEEPLVPAMTAEENAAIVQGNAAVALGTCGSASLSGTTVTVSFTGGCMVPSGLTATGTITLSVSVASGAVTVDADFDAVSVGAYDLDGSLSISTMNGTSYDVTLDLTSEGRTITGDVSLVATSMALMMSGELTTESGGTTRTVTITGLVWNRGDCYPSAGLVGIGVGSVTQTIAFDSSTASGGVVLVTFGRFSTTATLPAYGECPTAG